MSEDVESYLTDFLKTTEFSLQLDESSLPNNESLLLAYVLFIKYEKKLSRTIIRKKKIRNGY
jgi:hypothetical protein